MNLYAIVIFVLVFIIYIEDSLVIFLQKKSLNFCLKRFFSQIIFLLLSKTAFAMPHERDSLRSTYKIYII